MTNIKATQVLKDVVAVNLHFSIWTGRKKLAEQDLTLKGETPPKEIVNLGSKHTTDPKALKVFNTLKRRAERLCLAYGIPFLGGYAIPMNKADYVATELKKITDSFEVEKQAYLLKHEKIQNEWIEKYPAFERILVKALTPAKDVEQRLSACFSMFQVQSAQEGITSVDTGLSNQVESLTGTLDDDILKSATKLLESLTGAIQPNQTNVNGLKGLREKVEGLAFLNGKFSNLVNEIKKVECAMPLVGKLTQAETNVLSGLLFRMSDSDKLQSLMQSLTSPAPQPEEIEPVINAVMPEVMPFSDDDFDFDMGSIEPTSSNVNPAEHVTFF